MLLVDEVDLAGEEGGEPLVVEGVDEVVIGEDPPVAAVRL